MTAQNVRVPVIPGRQKYFVVQGDEPVGPLTIDQLKALYGKGAVHQRAFVEGQQRIFLPAYV